MERQDSPVWGKYTSGTDPIRQCDPGRQLGVGLAISLDRHRMSVGFRRHCIWECRVGQVGVIVAASRDMGEGTDQSVVVKRQPTMTDTGCPCGQGGTAGVLSVASTTGVAPSRDSDMQSIWEANKQMLTEEIAMDVTFLVR